MIPYFIAMAVFIRLFVGFQTGSLDWILPWYGCKPDTKKSQLDGNKIMNFASAMMLLSLNGVFVLLYAKIIDHYIIRLAGIYLVITPIICMIVYTIIWSRDKK